MITELFAPGDYFWYGIFGLVFVITLMYCFRGLYVYKKRAVESAYFIAFSIPVFLWAGALVVSQLLELNQFYTSIDELVIMSASLFAPPLLLLHIRSQTTFKKVSFIEHVQWLAIPAILTLLEAVKLFELLDFDFFAIKFYNGQIVLAEMIAQLFLVWVVVRGFLFCFNVYYQMPLHMRRSTHQIVMALTAVTIAKAVAWYLPISVNAADILLGVAYLIALRSLFTAFFIASASNVIMTSRDFVFSSLTTIVIMTSLKGYILDWNHKRENGCYPLPDPKYKEPYMHYRNRIISSLSGRVSPYDENLFCVYRDDAEHSFLFTWHDISHHGRKFGYLVEIVEVNKIYARLRQLEGISYFDSHTKLYNRSAYIEQAKQIYASEDYPLLVIVGDVNNLKKINDTKGHLLGDKLLLFLTEVINQKAPDGSFIARIGGDEFALLVPGGVEKDAQEFIAKVAAALKPINDPDIGKPSMSWGYSVMRSIEKQTYNEVFLQADAMMYKSKHKLHEVTLSGVIPPESY